MKSKENNNNLEINTTEEVLEITSNPIELIYVVEEQEAVTLPTQTLHKTQEELDGIIDAFFKANCCMTSKKKAHFTQVLTDQYWA
jgi:hypothetical protein